MKHLDNFFCYFAFASGFATGNYIGITIENKLSIGVVMVRVIFQVDSIQTIQLLKENNFRITTFDAQGTYGPVKVLFSTLKRRELKSFLKILNQHNPNAFYTIEDVKKVQDGFLYRKKTVSDFSQVRK